MIPSLSIPELLHSLRVLTFVEFVMANASGRDYPDFSLRRDTNSDGIICEYNNGQGDDFSAFLRKEAAVLFGLTHESAVWRAVLEDDIKPQSFFDSLPEGMFERISVAQRNSSRERFDLSETSFCFHRSSSGPWVYEKPWLGIKSVTASNDPDLTGDLLSCLDVQGLGLDRHLEANYEAFQQPGIRIPPNVRTLSNIVPSTIQSMDSGANVEECLTELQRIVWLELPG